MTKRICCTLALVFVVFGLLSQRAFAFRTISKKGHEVRWKNVPVKYYIAETNPESFLKVGHDVIGESLSLEDIVARAFNTWESTQGVEIDSSYQGEVSGGESGDDGKNQIAFVRSNWSGLSFNPPSSALAVTVTTYDMGSGRIVDSDIYFNDVNYDWSHIDTEEEANLGLIDIQNVITHEIGHMLGLAHSSESPYEGLTEFRDATMYFISSAGETFRRNLGLDDQNAIQHLYPTDELENDIIEPLITDVYPKTGSNYGNEIMITVSGDYFGPLTMIKLKGGSLVNDEVCKIVSRTETSIKCILDLYSVTSGEYDIVAANSYYKSDVLSKSFSVTGRSIEYMENAGGCGKVEETERNKGGAVSLLALIILIYPLRLYIRRERLELVRVKSKRK